MERDRIQVGALRISAADSAAVVPFRNDFEDALRTAALPFPTGAVVRVRRLRLGRLRRGLSRQALSGLIAEAFAATPAVAVNTARDPIPERYDVVVFADMVCAAEAALMRLTQGQPFPAPLRETFPNASPASVATAIEAVLIAAITQADAGAVGRLAVRPTSAPIFAAALATLSTRQLLSVWRTLSIAPPARVVTAMEAQAARRGEGATTQNSDDPAGEASNAIDAAVALAPHPVPTAVARLRRVQRLSPGAVALAAVFAAHAAGGPQAARAMAAAFTAAPIARRQRLRPTSSRQDFTRKGQRERRAATPPEDAPQPALSGTDLGATPDAVLGTSAVAAIDPPVTTRFGGLWFFIRALHAVGASACDGAFGEPVAQAALQRFAERLGLGEDDPTFDALGDVWLDRSAPLPPPRAAAPAQQRPQGQRLWAARSGDAAIYGPRHSLVAGAVDAGGLRRLRGANTVHRRACVDDLTKGALVDGLVLAAQRLVRQATGQTWRQITLREGVVALSDTHLTITFDMDQLDVDVRRAGLDLDPGFVPWLGRVVRFGYRAKKDGAGGGPVRP